MCWEENMEETRSHTHTFDHLWGVSKNFQTVSNLGSFDTDKSWLLLFKERCYDFLNEQCHSHVRQSMALPWYMLYIYMPYNMCICLPRASGFCYMGTCRFFHKPQPTISNTCCMFRNNDHVRCESHLKQRVRSGWGRAGTCLTVIAILNLTIVCLPWPNSVSVAQLDIPCTT